jgi:Ca2+-binding RTX toxin-like protein
MAIVTGNALPNVLIGTNLADTISGLGGNDVLIGLGGADLLNGGAGADVMIGGTGNDTYIVDNVGDTVAEGFNEGIDRIVTSINLSLSAPGRFDVENLTLAGGAVVGVGNGLGNQIVGNNFANTLSGLAGNDSLFGLGGNDNMFGGIGNDFLNGGLGADTMTGGTGNDTYIVDNPGDIVTEFAGGGIDQIISSISTSLNFGGRLNVENLTLTGTAAVGVGNALNNTIIGDNVNNNLIGLGGNDRLFGGIGADTLQGGVGNDLHNGGAGIDTIVTGAGSDTILFNAPLGVANADRVLDFAPASDTMLLENAVFTGLTQGAFLPAGDFVVGAAAVDASDRIIYNQATGNLFFDQDGNGAAAQVLFANLANTPVLTSNDFFVV